MACGDITAGRLKQCKKYQGGTKKLYLFNFQSDPFTILNGEATAINADLTAVYEFDLVGDSNTFTENKVGDRSTGTSVNTQTITAFMAGMDAPTSVEFNELVKGYPQAVMVDRSNIYHALGIDDGIDFTVDGATGGAKTDGNGFTLTGTATTGDLSPKLDSATITALLNLVA